MNILAIASPFFLARRALRREVSRMATGTRGIVLDIGCGTAPYKELFSKARHFGIESKAGSDVGSRKDGADVLYDGRRLPIADVSVDNVLCNQVLEHVFEPRDFLQEIHRVLKPGGRLMLTVPFVWDEHEQPWDFARYSSFGLRHLALTNGFDVVEARRTLADASLFAQIWLAYWFKVLGGRQASVPAKLLLATMCVPVNLAGMAMGLLLPASPDLYLDNAMILQRQAVGERA